MWQAHRAGFVDQFSKKFYWTAPHFISDVQVSLLLDWALTIEQEGLLQAAQVGKGLRKKQVADIRSDKIFWIDNFVSERGLFLKEFYEGLQLIALRDLYLPSKRFECHFAKYEKGSFYKLHRDRHAEKPGRLLTCVLYLTDWKTNGGGELVLYDEELRKVVIHPEPGRVVVFDSALEHEVAKSFGDRWSLTGWVRSDLHPGLRLS